MPPVENTTQPTENPYDFIVNNAPKAKKLNLLGPQISFKQRILTILAGALILIILIVVVSSIFSSKPKTAGLFSVAQQQGTLLSMAKVGGLSASQQITRNLAANISLTMTSQQLGLVHYIASTGTKVTSGSLLSGHTTELSSELTSSPANNFDNLYVQLTQTELSRYVGLIKSAYSSSDPASQRILLSNLYVSANLLIKQANSTASDL